MKNPASDYTSTIACHTTRAAAIAAARGTKVEIDPPALKLRRERSAAFLIVHPDHLVLALLEVEPSDRHKHHGSAMLDDVIAIGEQLALRIDVIAESGTRPGQPGLIQSKLKSWYRRHDFVGEDDVLMRRAPTGAVPPRRREAAYV